jgi:hypothetical protein
MTFGGEVMATTHLVLIILAMVSFLLAALDVKPQRILLTPLGLFFWSLAALLAGR